MALASTSANPAQSKWSVHVQFGSASRSERLIGIRVLVVNMTSAPAVSVSSDQMNATTFQRCLQENPAALLVLLLPAIQRVTASCCRSICNYIRASEMEDFFQEIIVLLIEHDFRRLRNFDPNRSAFETWFRSFARRQILKRYCRESRHHFDRARMAKSTLQSPETALLENERLLQLRAVFAQLSEKERTFLRVLFTCHFEAVRIGNILGMTATQVYLRKHRLIRKLHLLLD